MEHERYVLRSSLGGQKRCSQWFKGCFILRKYVCGLFSLYEKCPSVRIKKNHNGSVQVSVWNTQAWHGTLQTFCSSRFPYWCAMEFLVVSGMGL